MLIKIIGFFAFILITFGLNANAFAEDYDHMRFVSSKVVQEKFVLSYYLSGFIIIYGLAIYLQKANYKVNEIPTNFFRLKK